MTSPIYHAESSARLFGGRVEDYLPIHQWFDATAHLYPDFRHRALRHHSEGIREATVEFGPFLLVIESGRERRVPVHYIGEQHCIEDTGRIPTVADWCSQIQVERWMHQGRRVERRVDATRAGSDCHE